MLSYRAHELALVIHLRYLTYICTVIGIHIAMDLQTVSLKSPQRSLILWILHMTIIQSYFTVKKFC